MSFGKMNVPIQILSVHYVKDKDGFAQPQEEILACVRAYKEDKNTTEKWTNRAVLQDASALFRFRVIPNLNITTEMVIDCFVGRYNILSIENVRGKNMYLEVVGRLEVSSPGNNESENA